MLAVASRRFLYALKLPNYFKLTFEVYGPTLTTNGAAPLLQLLNLVDPVNGVDYVGVAFSDSRALYFYYNEAMVTEEADSAQLVAGYASAWTSVKITSDNVQATISTSNNFTQVYRFATQAYGSLPEDMLVHLYASSKRHTQSAGGYVRNIQIVGKRRCSLVFIYSPW
jgi:hypothetical protein